MSDAAKNFDLLATNFNVLYNYFDNSIKLFSDLYLVEFLDNLAKSFFPCSIAKLYFFMYLFSIHAQIHYGSCKIANHIAGLHSFKKIDLY